MSLAVTARNLDKGCRQMAADRPKEMARFKQQCDEHHENDDENRALCFITE